MPVRNKKRQFCNAKVLFLCLTSCRPATRRVASYRFYNAVEFAIFTCSSDNFGKTEYGLDNIHAILVWFDEPFAVFVYRLYWVYIEDKIIELFAAAIDFVEIGKMNIHCLNFMPYLIPIIPLCQSQIRRKSHTECLILLVKCR